jgi:membrane-bound lytic murein transglycosylase B
MQPASQSYPKPPVVRPRRARRRFRDRRSVRVARGGMRGLLTFGVVLSLLGGSQAGVYAIGPAAGKQPSVQHSVNSSTSAPTIRQSSNAAAQGSIRAPRNWINGGSPPLGSVGSPPSSTAPEPTATPLPSPGPTIGGANVPVGDGRIPATVLAAYLRAQRWLAGTEPGCHLPWQLLAAIGQVESGQAANGDVTTDGTTRTPIFGPPLNGNGFAAIRAADGGWARAQGPMQFIPSSWAVWGVDGNGDGQADPQNVFDAALSAADYLCSAGRDLSNSVALAQAILGYNGTQAYLATVLAWMRYYQHNGAQPAAGGAPLLPGSGPTPSRSTPNPNSSKRTRAKSEHTTTTARHIHSRQPIAASPSPTSATPIPGLSPTPSPSLSPPSRPPVSPSPTDAPVPSTRPTASPTRPSSAPAPSHSPTVAPTPSAPSSASSCPSASASGAVTPSPSPSPSGTPVASPSPSASPTAICR